MQGPAGIFNIHVDMKLLKSNQVVYTHTSKMYRTSYMNQKAV